MRLLVVGGRVERNPYTGTELLRTVRLAWTPAPAHSLWASATCTVRGPSRLDADAFIPGRAPYVLRGGPAIRSEVAKVIELGYRSQPTAQLSYSVTAFFNEYDHLRTQEVDPSGTFVTFGNLMQGRARGLELWGSYQATPGWHLSAGLLALHESPQLKRGSTDLARPGTVGKNPAHTALLRSASTLAADKQLDIAVRKVGALSEVPGYTALDARLGWELQRGLELSLYGRNLNGAHGEYGPVVTRAHVARAVGMKLVWQN